MVADLPKKLAGKKSRHDRLLEQWRLFCLFHDVAGDLRKITVEDLSKPPGWYWLRTRQHWPDLSELMLFWLCIPVSTAGLERAFSFQTASDADSRRIGKLTAENQRDDMMGKVHKQFALQELKAAL